MSTVWAWPSNSWLCRRLESSPFSSKFKFLIILGTKLYQNSIMAQILGLFASVLLVLVLSVVRHRVRYALKANARGCKTPKNFYPTRDPFLGLDVYWKMLKAEGQGRYLEFVTNRFRRYGNTFVARRLLFDVIHTIDADNLKHVLSTDFYSFRLSSTRVNGGAPILGRGIFLSDGIPRCSPSP